MTQLCVYALRTPGHILGRKIENKRAGMIEDWTSSLQSNWRAVSASEFPVKKIRIVPRMEQSAPEVQNGKVKRISPGANGFAELCCFLLVGEVPEFWTDGHSLLRRWRGRVNKMAWVDGKMVSSETHG